jgi:hypothetical protein
LPCQHTCIIQLRYLSHNHSSNKSKQTSSSSSNLGVGTIDNRGDISRSRSRLASVRGSSGGGSSESVNVDGLESSEEFRSGVGTSLADIGDDGEGKLGDGCGRGEGQTVGGIGGGLDVSAVKGGIGRVEDSINDMSNTVEEEDVGKQNLGTIHPSTSILSNSKSQVSSLERRNADVGQVCGEEDVVNKVVLENLLQSLKVSALEDWANILKGRVVGDKDGKVGNVEKARLVRTNVTKVVG